MKIEINVFKLKKEIIYANYLKRYDSYYDIIL